MTNEDQSKRRRAENEVLFRQHNERLEKLATKVLAPNEEADFELNFLCECSSEDCADPIRLSVNDWLGAREGKREFILKHGHEQGDIERVVREYDAFIVVEKFEDPPGLSKMLNET